MDERVQQLLDFWRKQPHIEAAIRDEQDNAAQLALDSALYGVSFTDITGRRIAPENVTPAP